VLKRRLRKRGYSPAKVTENVEAELIGVVSASCISRFGRLRCAEFDTSSRSVRISVGKVAGLLSVPRSEGAPVDWVPLYSSAEKLRSLLSDERTDSAFT
jgi:broad-specificity NMP kinase